MIAVNKWRKAVDRLVIEAGRHHRPLSSRELSLEMPELRQLRASIEQELERAWKRGIKDGRNSAFVG